MTFEQATGGGYLPYPFWWCRKHGPDDPDFESEKMPIDFAAMDLFRTVHEKRIFCRHIRKALGIKKGTRISETFAHRFFAHLAEP
jgi:hypothetical protein